MSESLYDITMFYDKSMMSAKLYQRFALQERLAFSGC